MTVDIEKLEALAKAAIEQEKRWKDAGEPWPIWNKCLLEMQASANPAAVLELIADFKSTAHDHELLRAENEALRKDASIQDLLCCNVCLCMIQPANKLQAENDRLKAENEALRKDAERYQWLRDESESIHQFYLSTPIWFTGVKFSKENVDSTIDAAMSEEASHD